MESVTAGLAMPGMCRRNLLAKEAEKGHHPWPEGGDEQNENIDRKSDLTCFCSPAVDCVERLRGKAAMYRNHSK